MLEDFETKTNYLIETKGLLKDRINSLGGSITSGTTFRDYLVWLDSLYEALEEKTITGLPDSLEGKCEQSGTPTPTSPQPINITTGRQVVSVCGKNLFTGTLVQKGFNSNTGQLFDNNTRVSTETYLSLKAGTYKISVKNSTNRQLVYYVYDNAGTYLSGETYTGWLSIPTTISLANDRKLRFGFRKPNNDNITPSEVEEIQLEKGNQATTYEAYNGNTYEINLGKNLFYINDCTLEQNGGKVSVSNGNTISITGTFSAGTNISFDSYVDFSSANSQLGNAMTLSVQNIVNSGTASITPNRFFIASANTFPYLQPDQTTGYQTKTITEAFNRCRLYVPAGTYDTTINVQLEKGGIPTTFSPYKTPIYLGKIGTYQDYIFKNTQDNPLYDSNLEEGQWYLHKEIGRVVLNGSENWSGGTIAGDYLYIYCNDYDNILLPNKSYLGLSNYFKVLDQTINTYTPVITTDSMSLGSDTAIAGNRVRVKINKATTNTLANFKTWLSTHNTEVYYVLDTPTNTLIEDEELINQLNEIEIFTVISEDFYN